jgi:SAM-dependent methyltransferase
MTDWNERHKSGSHASDEPHPLVEQFAAALTPGCALDLACGTGRNAIRLAKEGWQVTAVDGSSVAIEILRERSAEKGVTIDARLADLERREFTIQPESYDLIVVCNYLQRDLFPSIREGTRIGGAVIAVIAMVDDDPNVKPMNPAYLLKPGELRREFEGWELMYDFEGKPSGGHSRSTAQIVARREKPSPTPLLIRLY